MDSDNHSQLTMPPPILIKSGTLLSKTPIEAGCEYVIESISLTLASDVRQRLLELGFKEGESLICQRRTPFGGPWIFEIAGTVFSIDSALTSAIHVRKK